MSADWSKDNPASIRGMRDAGERDEAERRRKEKDLAEWRSTQCGAVNVSTGRNCTKERGHSGAHR